MVIIEEFMPAALTEDDLDGLIREAISSTDAQGMQGMGRVMNELRPMYLGGSKWVTWARRCGPRWRAKGHRKPGQVYFYGLTGQDGTQCPQPVRFSG